MPNFLTGTSEGGRVRLFNVLQTDFSPVDSHCLHSSLQVHRMNLLAGLRLRGLVHPSCPRSPLPQGTLTARTF
jgi:hypothetical protein